MTLINHCHETFWLYFKSSKNVSDTALMIVTNWYESKRKISILVISWWKTERHLSSIQGMQRLMSDWTRVGVGLLVNTPSWNHRRQNVSPQYVQHILKIQQGSTALLYSNNTTNRVSQMTDKSVCSWNWWSIIPFQLDLRMNNENGEGVISTYTQNGEWHLLGKFDRIFRSKNKSKWKLPSLR